MRSCEYLGYSHKHSTTVILPDTGMIENEPLVQFVRSTFRSSDQFDRLEVCSEPAPSSLITSARILACQAPS